MIDQKYIDHGIVEVIDKKPYKLYNLTKFGQLYGMTLLLNLTLVTTNSPAPLEVYQSVEVCEIPKHILRETPTTIGFTEKGIRWICKYIEKNEFNEYLYRTACEMQGCVMK